MIRSKMCITCLLISCEKIGPVKATIKRIDLFIHLRSKVGSSNDKPQDKIVIIRETIRWLVDVRSQYVRCACVLTCVHHHHKTIKEMEAIPIRVCATLFSHRKVEPNIFFISPKTKLSSTKSLSSLLEFRSTSTPPSGCYNLVGRTE